MPFERALDHQRDSRDQKEDSHMHKHALEAHEGRDDVEWEFKVIRTFQKSLIRQLSEAVRVKTRC